VRPGSLLAPSLHSCFVKSLQLVHPTRAERRKATPARVRQKATGRVRPGLWTQDRPSQVEDLSDTTAKRVPLLAPRGDGLLHGSSANAFLFFLMRNSR
jgi:hypothetical protein